MGVSPQNLPGHFFRGLQQGLTDQMGIAGGGLGLFVPQQRADDGQAEAVARSNGGKGMAQVVQADVVQASAGPDTAPGFLQVDEVGPLFIAADHVRIAVYLGYGLQ